VPRPLVEDGSVDRFGLVEPVGFAQCRRQQGLRVQVVRIGLDRRSKQANGFGEMPGGGWIVTGAARDPAEAPM
jgi:hypothetical protein